MHRSQVSPLQQVKDMAAYNWRNVLTHVGATDEMLSGNHMKCPLCKQGKDCFRFTDYQKGGEYFCNKCGHGDGLDFISKYCDVSLMDAAHIVSRYFGKELDTSKAMEVDHKKVKILAVARRLASQAKVITPEDTAGRYLISRGIDPAFFSAALRLHDGVNTGDGQIYPTMLASVCAPGKGCVSLHQTFLDRMGRKAPMADPRRYMKISIPKGSAIRLHPVQDGVLGVAEGIETALSAHMLEGIPVWAAMDTGKMANFAPPADVHTVVIFADNDANFAGLKGAANLAHSLSIRGLTVRIEIPDKVGTDFNDVLMERRGVIAA